MRVVRLMLPIAWLGLALLAVPSFAQDEESGPDFARNGPYLGIGGVFMQPGEWARDFDHNYTNDASRIATKNAKAALAVIQPSAVLSPPVASIFIDGVDLHPMWGVGGVAGWRVARNLGLEVEGEWIDGSNESSFTVMNTGDPGGLKIDDIWTITLNVRVYPFTGRVQPFAVAGVGLQHSSFEDFGRSTGNTTTGVIPNTNPPTVVQNVPADFQLNERKTKTDGALRAGAGLDVYLTPHVAGELKVDYVIPFVPTGQVHVDYLSVRLGLLYRF